MKREIFSFLAIGVLNTLVCWIVYWLMLLIVTAQPAYIVAFIVSTLFSFVMNARHTFRVAPEKGKLLKFLAFQAASYFLGRTILDVSIATFDINQYIAILAVSALVVPFNFLGSRFILSDKTKADS